MTHYMTHWATIGYRESEGRESGQNSLRENNRESVNLCGVSRSSLCHDSYLSLHLCVSSHRHCLSPDSLLCCTLYSPRRHHHNERLLSQQREIEQATLRIIAISSYCRVRTSLQAHPCLHSQTPKTTPPSNVIELHQNTSCPTITGSDSHLFNKHRIRRY